MPTNHSQLDYIVDQLSFLPKLTIKKMFGEYAFYSNDKYIGLICDDKVFLKTNKLLIDKIGDDSQRSCESSKNSLHIPVQILEDQELLKEIFKLI